MRSPDLYPLSLDVFRDHLYFIRLDEAQYRAASFLDQRIAANAPPGEWMPWPRVQSQTAALPVALDFIFHIGHVGSTLLSRLLGDAPAVFSLREPEILRTLAKLAFELPTPESLMREADFDARLDAMLALWSRTWRPGQRALVKATSLVGEMAPTLMGHAPDAKAILMLTQPEVYMATILGGPNSRIELRVAAQDRVRRLNRRLGEPAIRLTELSEGELAAMAWVCEMGGLADAAARYPARVLWLDFEALLGEPRPALAAALVHLHGQVDEPTLAAMLASPHFGRYAKGPEHAYDAALRRQVLDQARAEHRAELARGGLWLERAAGRFAAIEAITRAAPGPREGDR